MYDKLALYFVRIISNFSSKNNIFFKAFVTILLFDNTSILDEFWSKVSRVFTSLLPYKKLNDVKQCGSKDSVYLYDLKTIVSKCNILSKNLDCVNNFYYAMKANNNLWEIE